MQEGLPAAGVLYGVFGRTCVVLPVSARCLHAWGDRFRSTMQMTVHSRITFPPDRPEGPENSKTDSENGQLPFYLLSLLIISF